MINIKNAISQTRFWVLVSSIVLITSCSGGGSNPPTNNFTSDTLTVLTNDPRIGHPMKVLVQLSAENQASDVGVQLMAIDDTEDPEAEVRQIPLGTEFIESLPDGSSIHELEVVIPASVEFAGPYHIAAIVDPVDQVIEVDEEDNTSTTEVNLGDSNFPNILLSEVALDRGAIIVNTDEYLEEVGEGNVYNADAGGTITIGADGLELGETAEIEAFASLKIIRTDINETHELPLYLWNSEEQRYINAYGIDPDTGAQTDIEWLPMGTFTPLLSEIKGDEAELEDVARNSEHMDFYFPGRLGFELEQALRYPPEPITGLRNNIGPPPTIPPPDLTKEAIDELKAFLTGLPFSGRRGDESTSLAALDFEVCVKVRSSDPDLNDNNPDDNEICPALEIFLPPEDPDRPPRPDLGGYEPEFSTPSDPLSESNGFATNNNNKHFAFNIDFSAGMSADDRGYIEEVTAGLPVKVFGKEFDFFRATARAQLVPEFLNKPSSEESGFSYEIRFLELVIDSLQPTTASVSASSDIVEVKYSKMVEKEQQFFVGPVPLIAGGSIGGEIGLDYSFGYGSDEPSIFGTDASNNPMISVGTTIGPVAKLEGLVFAGVGTKVFSVGVEGVLTLLEEKLVYFIGTEIETFNDGFEDGDV